MEKSRYNDFTDFFQQATKHKPYSYQKELAKQADYNVINIPTGSGKTESAVLSLWLWKRINDSNTPRRLVYCLPMRVLAEQTHEKITRWIKNLGLEKRISVELFMGGSDTKIERIYPNKDCIIVGTQDILVSGALNRAYGSSPTTWPIVFGLLNNDCMWIMDEVQIMENALPTSTQLDSFRNDLGVFGQHKTIWMSATIDTNWINTVNFPKENIRVYRLLPTKIGKDLKIRHLASKTLQKAPFQLKNRYNDEDIMKMLKLHVPGTSTAIIVNTVQRARSVFEVLSKHHDCKLIHSRFRGSERRDLNSWLSNFAEDKDQIVISTQVIEAGVDISVRTMITEIAPWSNMVQRFGRCNRYGRLTTADIYWIDVDDAMCMPYEASSVGKSRDMVKKLNKKSVSPENLVNPTELKIFDAVLRQRDIIGLADTTPDLSGGHIDVSRFVRNMNLRLNVGVFWRDVSGDPSTQPRPDTDEVCDVPISELKDFLKRKKYWIWNYAKKLWENATLDDLTPGQTIMLDKSASGYSTTVGWNPSESDTVTPLPSAKSMPEAHDSDLHSELNHDVTLEAHTKHVQDEMHSILCSIPHVGDDVKRAIMTAVAYHDVGKAHHVFQNALRKNNLGRSHKDSQIWAKGKSLAKYERSGFRHEVASMLAYLGQEDRPKNELRDLVAYLIVSHHGKVRFSLGNAYKTNSTVTEDSYLLGISIKGELFPEFSSSIVNIMETRINMSLANMGRDKLGNPSWSERVLRLRDQYGPFRLGYMETLLRRADWSASEKESRGEYKTA